MYKYGGYSIVKKVLRTQPTNALGRYSPAAVVQSNEPRLIQAKKKGLSVACFLSPPLPPPLSPSNTRNWMKLKTKPQKCVQTGCTPEVACGLNIEGDGGDALGTEYQVEMSALMEVPDATPTSSAAGAGDKGDEFETAVALWLGVDPGDVSVSERAE